MTNEIKSGGIPTSEYYEAPYIPSAYEAANYLAIPLLPVEAHFILVNNAGKLIQKIDRLALQRISESDEPDFTLDFKAVRKQVAKELDMDDDWG